MTLRYLIVPEERRKKLKDKLNSEELIKGIEVHNAIGALIINDLEVEIEEKGRKIYNEFDFFWESSLTDSASKGHPDIELVSFDSRLKTVSEIFEVTNKPMIVDGDTGGDIHHFEYLVPKLEKLGVSAVVIEDKVFPKRNSLEVGAIQIQEDPDKFAEKIKAGKSIQKSDDFMIFARIESLIAGKSVSDALKRARKYLEAGADGIVIHSNSSDPKEIFQFAKEYEQLCKELNKKKPLVAIPTTYNMVYESELKDKGFGIVIYANHLLRATYKAMQDVGKIILQKGRSLETEPFISSVGEIFEKVGFLDIKQKDQELSQVPSVIIPAAGENPELQHILGDLPKPLLKINKKTILEHQIDLFRKFGLQDINVVIGYQKHRFDIRGINYIVNPEYKTKGILHSLMSARAKMKKGFIYTNSDNLIDERLLKELIERKEDMVLVVDTSYLYYKHEINKKLDAVITKKGSKATYQRLRQSDEEVMLIGQKIPKDKITHEYAGIAKFSKKGSEALIKVYEDCLVNHSGRFHEAETFEKAADTDILQELINRSFQIFVHETSGGWLEIHNEKDVATAKEMLKNIEHSI